MRMRGGMKTFFTTCSLLDISPDQATRDHVALWVRELTTPSPRRGTFFERVPSTTGLSNATLHQRLTAVRLFFDFLVEKGVRADNPVGCGRYTPGNGFGGSRHRGLLSRHHKRSIDSETPIVFATAMDLMISLQLETIGAQGVVKRRPTFSGNLRTMVSRLIGE
jgi:hypothetical protein